MKKHLKPFGAHYIFARTGFMAGMGSLLSLAGNHFPFRFSSSSVVADNMALYGDWRAMSPVPYKVPDKKAEEA